MDHVSELESAARLLSASADYRVIRRLAAHDTFAPGADGPTAIAVVVDTETTGRFFSDDAMIEIALLRF